MTLRRRLSPLALAGLALTAGLPAATPLAQGPGVGPGQRVLLDAHNCYPYEGRYTDRLTRALATGTPVAIEQDLIWRVDRATGRGESVVGHDLDKVADAPSFEEYFVQTVAPVLDAALRSADRATWPVIVLNLDFKTNEPAHHARVREVLGRHSAWLTSAPRTATPDRPAPLTVGPLLVLTGSNDVQQTSFHDALPEGTPLWLFGAYEAPPPPGDTAEARALALHRMTPGQLLPRKATNYRRWANFPWLVVEAGGQTRAGDWSAADRTRLDALVDHAHGQGLWIRFYTLNGHAPGEDQGWSAGYNFGSLDAVRIRWQAAREAGVDFIATDQYEQFRMKNSR